MPSLFTYVYLSITQGNKKCNLFLYCIAKQSNTVYTCYMASTQKGFRVEDIFLQVIEKIRKKEHLGFSPFVKRCIWFYIEQHYPGEAEEAKRKMES